MTTRTGAQVLVDQLRLHGVDTVFCVPGESYLRVLDELYEQRDAIRLITTRQEGGAAFMAEAYGKLTGRPGICFVTRGPGASNASIGVHTAFQDSTPMLLCIGQVPRSQLGRDAFQEVDYRQMFGPLAKLVVQIDDARRVAEIMSRAFHIATSGRPGPVVLVLPEDMQGDLVDQPAMRPFQPIQAAPAPADLEKFGALLSQAERPIVIVGREGWTREGIADLRAFVAAQRLPVVPAVRAQDMIDNHAPEFVGVLGLGVSQKLLARIREADLLLVIGSRIDGLSTIGYSLIDIPRPRQKLVHVYPDPSELGRIYQGELLINATLPAFAAAARTLPVSESPRWAAWSADARREYDAHRLPIEAPGPVNFSAIVADLSAHLPPDAIITTGAGNYTAWANRFYQFSEPRTQLGPISGAMGYGLPAAIAAKTVHPERTVIAFAGDGCFLMNGQELATAMQYDLPIIVIVVNNSMLGTIRLHQERRFPGHVHGTTLANPNFAEYARAFGAFGEVVERTADFAAAFERAQSAGRPALIELRVNHEAMLPDVFLSNL